MPPADQLRASLAALEQPMVMLQILQRANDAFADRQLRTPTQGADVGRIQKDERTVADPAAVAACVSPPRLDAEVIANPAQRIVNTAVLLGTEVGNRHRLLCFFN